MSKVGKFAVEEHSLSHIRCAGRRTWCFPSFIIKWLLRVQVSIVYGLVILYFNKQEYVLFQSFLWRICQNSLLCELSSKLALRSRVMFCVSVIFIIIIIIILRTFCVSLCPLYVQAYLGSPATQIINIQLLFLQVNSFHPCSFSPLACVLPFEEVTSRTFASLQSSCHHSCDMHKALQEATERFRSEYQDNTVRQTAAEQQRSWKNRSGKRLQHLKCTVNPSYWKV